MSAMLSRRGTASHATAFVILMVLLGPHLAVKTVVTAVLAQTGQERAALGAGRRASTRGRKAPGLQSRS